MKANYLRSTENDKIVMSKLNSSDIRGVKNIISDAHLYKRILNEEIAQIEYVNAISGLRKKEVYDMIERGELSFFSNTKQSTKYFFKGEIDSYYSDKLCYKCGLLNFKKNITWVSLYMAEGVLQPRLFKIFEMYLLGESLDNISNEFNISTERTRQLIEKGKNRMCKYSLRLKKYDDVYAKHQELLAENEILKMKNKAMMDKFKLSKEDIKVAVKSNESKNITLEEVDLSVRAYNCLKAARLSTLGDITTYPKYELLKFRNMGRKSLIEIEELLSEYNLQFESNESN